MPLAAGWLFPLMIACVGEAPAPRSADVQAPPETPAEAPAEPERAWVIASRLNVRQGPGGTHALQGALSIGTVVDVVERTDGWARVELASGTTGWVLADYLASKRLGHEEAVARAQATDAPDEALGWWQRAAAIDADRATLEGLAAAYEALGDRRAREVRAQLAWPHTLLLVRDTPPEGRPIRTVEVEWDEGYWAERGPIAPERWGRLGIETDATWWVLPDRGPAVQAHVAQVRSIDGGACADNAVHLVELRLGSPLPPGVRALAAHRGAPPAAWAQDRPGPVRPYDDALVAAHRAAAERAGDHPYEVHLAADGTDWLGTALWETDEVGELGNPLFDGVQVRVGADHATLEPLPASPRPFTLWGVRDLTGDGQAERVLSEGCATWAYDAEQSLVQTTVFRCCGC